MSNKSIISEMTDMELLKKFQDEKVAFTKMKLFHKTATLDSPIELRFKRREIARLFTEINKRGIR